MQEHNHTPNKLSTKDGDKDKKYQSQIERIADLFDDRQPKTSKMVSELLNIKNGSTSRHITTLRIAGIIEYVGNSICPISGYKSSPHYRCVMWQKKVTDMNILTQHLKLL
jgi:hypothetical protein